MATIKVNGKPQILGTSSPQTPESIDLKFDLVDYVDDLTLRAKNSTNRPRGVGGAKGWNMMFSWVIFSFFTFLANLWRTHFWEYRRILRTGWRVSVGIDFLGRSQHSSFIFSSLNSPKTENFIPIFGLKNYSWKCLTVEMLIYKLPLIIIIASPKWHSE